MKIILTAGGKERKLFLPMKTVLKLVLKSSVATEKKQTEKLFREISACLKAYKKEYGSFVLLGVEERGEEYEKITIVV